jgi:hypothetical protein
MLLRLGPPRPAAADQEQHLIARVGIECTDSASIEADPVISAATSLVAAMPRLAASAASTARIPPLPCPPPAGPATPAGPPVPAGPAAAGESAGGI